MRNTSKALIILVAILVFGFGMFYEYVNDYEALSTLKIELHNVNVSNVELTSEDFQLSFNLHNPGDHDVPLFWVELDVYVGDTYIGRDNISETRVFSGSSITHNMTFTVEPCECPTFSTLIVNGSIYSRIPFGIIPVSLPFHTQIQLSNGLGYQNITVEQAKELIETNPFLVILDVRTELEFQNGHIEHAINIPIDDLQQRQGILIFKDDLLVYCRAGVRSLRAMQFFAGTPFLIVYNMVDGIEAWEQAEYPIVIEP